MRIRIAALAVALVGGMVVAATPAQAAPCRPGPGGTQICAGQPRPYSYCFERRTVVPGPGGTDKVYVLRVCMYGPRPSGI